MYISKEKIEDTDWKSPVDAGIIITNFALNEDESIPHLHITFVPYSENCSSGQQMQNTPEGKKPQMVRDAFGVIEWIAEQIEKCMDCRDYTRVRMNVEIYRFLIIAGKGLPRRLWRQN